VNGSSFSTPWLIEAKHITKRFAGVVALSDVTFRAGPASVVALLGDNGSGKSTLVKVLSGVTAPDSGTIVWQGSPVCLRSARDGMELGISVVHQDLSLIDSMSVWRNMFLGREEEIMRGVGPVRVIEARKARDLARAAMREMGIELSSIEQSVSMLSGGERQAVSIARAVHFESKLLILDEPTAALSLHKTEKVLNCIVRARAQNLAVIVITHDVNHVYPIADRFVVLAHGRCVADIGKGEADIETIRALITGGLQGLEGGSKHAKPSA
jgi:simple sugar transport system ATP-binding protein